MADGRVGEGVGGLALHGVGEAGAGVLGDGPVVSEVAAAAGGGTGEQGKGGGLTGARAGLQGEVVAGVESVGGGALFVGEFHGVGLSGSRASACPTAASR